MRSTSKLFALLVSAITAAPAGAGLIVTSYNTLASTNGFAPTSQTQYFAEQRLDDLTPATAEVSGDWTGPNADGTPNTWHFVGASRAVSRTTITPDSYTVEGAASFAYTIDTTSDFVDPRSLNTYGPGGTAYYNGFFETDVVLGYAIQVTLNERGRVRLNRTGGPQIFDVINPNTAPHLLNLSGTLMPGRYQILAATGLGVGTLPSGANSTSLSGSFENLVFRVSVPEPGAACLAAVALILFSSKRRR